MLRSTTLFFIAGLSLAFIFASPTQAAETTPPVTTLLNIGGTLGSNSWYTSTVNINLRASDLESGLKSTTYRVDSNQPVTQNFIDTENSILNPSFEYGNTFAITNWDSVNNGIGFMWQTATPSKYGYGSAAVLTLGSQYSYWTNVNYPSEVDALQTYTASAWVKAAGLGNPGAWIEVWASDSLGIKSDQKLATSAKISGDWDWQLMSASFTVPVDYDLVYLKLGDQAAIGLAYFDGVSLNAGNGGATQFSIIDNGIHNFTYYSTDNANNVESTQSRGPIKIDTVAPGVWKNFSYSNTGNNHTFTMWVNAIDVTSGINPSTAQFRTYDRNGCDCWSSWQNVASTKRVDTGANAAAGYTGTVTLTTPAYDYGNSSSSTMPEVEFRISDMAASVGYSPTYALFGPWARFIGQGDVYSSGAINISGTTPAGQYSVDGVVRTGSLSISGLVSLKNWLITGQSILLAPSPSLSTLIPQFDKLEAKAQPLSGGRLPSTDGIYAFTGKFTIDSNTLTAGFQNGQYAAVIIIHGDLAINSEYELNKNAAVLFIVTGKVIYSGNIQKTAGVIMSAGSITTGASSKPLTHKGSLVSLGGINLDRDLGRNGNPNNTTTPAEVIEYQPQFLNNSSLSRLVNGGGGSDFLWQEGL